MAALGEEEKAGMGSLLQLNRLDYRIPPSLSVATSRSLKGFAANRDAYKPGDTMRFLFSSGASYVDTKNSYIKFYVNLFDATGAALTAAKLGQLAWDQSLGFSLIRGLRVIHSDGTELDHVPEGRNLMYRVEHKLKKSYDQRRTWVDLAYLPADQSKVGRQIPAFDSNDTAVTPTIFSTVIEVILPLHYLCRIFDSELLSPSYLMAGLRLELFLESNTNVFKKVADPGISYTVSQPEVCLETFMLTDGVTRAISQISANTGIEWYWEALHHAQTQSLTNNVSIQVNRALSRANWVLCFPRQTAHIGTYDHHSIFTEGNQCNGFQVQLGSQFIPAQSITSEESLRHSLIKAFGQAHTVDGQCRFDRDDFHNHAKGHAYIATPLESSGTLAQSGVSISAQRTAVLNLQFATNPGRTIDTFVGYTRVATLFLDAAVVRT